MGNLLSFLRISEFIAWFKFNVCGFWTDNYASVPINWSNSSAEHQLQLSPITHRLLDFHPSLKLPQRCYNWAGKIVRPHVNLTIFQLHFKPAKQSNFIVMYSTSSPKTKLYNRLDSIQNWIISLKKVFL